MSDKPKAKPSEIVLCGIPFGTPAEKDALKQVKDLGFTAVQIYTYWLHYEPKARGEFNWDKIDREVELIRGAGLKYVPFLLMGPRYTTPDWWIADPGHVGLRCLEHGKESPIESVWNAVFRKEISRVLEAFAAHYLPWDVLESVQPGICGDYGEAIFPALGNWPGSYHTHRGWWCGGDDARASFRDWLRKKYGGLDSLNDAWRTRHGSFDAVHPVLPHRAPSRTALFDQATWYRNSMTAYSEFWMAECRRIFPDVPAYLCTGGADDDTMLGVQFAEQAKIAARHRGGLRLTNEASKFSYNFPLTSHTHSACQFYGAYLGLEPVGPITTQGVRTRIFSSAAFGNRQLFHYYRNVFNGKNEPLPSAEVVREYSPLLTEQRVEGGIAFFWPVDQATLHGSMAQDVSAALLHIRRQYPVSPLSEEMILDGALEEYRCMVMIGAATTRPEVLKHIANWVREKGGLLIMVGTVCRDLELEPVAEFESLFGIGADSVEEWGHNSQRVAAPAEFPHMAQVPAFRAERGWLGLSSDTEKIGCAEDGIGSSGVEGITRIHPVSALFRRKHPGGGQAIFYCGGVCFQHDPEALFVDPCVIVALLNDICAMSGVDSLGTQPGEIARARVGGSMLILRENEIAQEEIAEK